MNNEYPLRGHTRRLPGFSYVSYKEMLDDYEMLNPEEFLSIYEPTETNDEEW